MAASAAIKIIGGLQAGKEAKALAKYNRAVEDYNNRQREMMDARNISLLDVDIVRMEEELKLAQLTLEQEFSVLEEFGRKDLARSVGSAQRRVQ